MIGKNTLQLNQQTMVAAVQMYLDSKLKEPVKVTDITLQKAGNSYANATYEVAIESQEATP